MKDFKPSTAETAPIKQLKWLILIFAGLHACLIILPALLSQQFIAYPLIKNGDVLDLVTPLILIPLYWLMFQLRPNSLPNRLEIISFLILAAIWVEGHSLHLASNSIGHLAQDLPGSDIATLTNFYDEKLSHYIWHFGTIGLSTLLIYRQWHHPFIRQSSTLGLEIIAGIIHGFVYFVDVIESATTPMGIPFALGVIIFGFWQRKKKITTTATNCIFSRSLSAC